MKQYNRDAEAARALRNGISRAKKKLAAHEFLAADLTLDRAVRTARRWTDGTHPKLRGNR